MSTWGLGAAQRPAPARPRSSCASPSSLTSSEARFFRLEPSCSSATWPTAFREMVVGILRGPCLWLGRRLIIQQRWSAPSRSRTPIDGPLTVLSPLIPMPSTPSGGWTKNRVFAIMVLSKISWSCGTMQIEKPCDWGAGLQLLPGRVAGIFQKAAHSWAAFLGFLRSPLGTTVKISSLGCRTEDSKTILSRTEFP